jgi:phosphocarrier protein HPr
MSTASREVIVTNEKGLHARPAMQFVDAAQGFKSNIIIRKPGDEGAEVIEVDGKSIMSMLTLEATEGTRLRIEAEGDDAEAAVSSLSELIQSKFGED